MTKQDVLVRQRVAAGVAWLDTHAPGWTDKIDLTQLDLTHCHLCVMGQVYGDYWEAPFHENVKGVEAKSTGVALGVDVTGISNRPETVALEAEWRRVIVKRRLAAQSVPS